MVAEPRNSTKLRSATDTDEPTADLIWVVSAVSREVSSPVRAVSKNGARERNEMARTPRSRTSATTRSPSVVTR